MITSRITALVCTLCLAAPAAAGASPATRDSRHAKGPYGVIVTSGAPAMATAKGPYGPIVTSPGPAIATAKGPYGATTTTVRPRLVAAKGPFGPVVGTRGARPAAAKVGATSRGETDGWRTAALFEAALVAALALGAVRLLGGRRPLARPGM